MNYDVPKTIEDYIHRIGRTGAASDPTHGEARAHSFIFVRFCFTASQLFYAFLAEFIGLEAILRSSILLRPGDANVRCAQCPSPGRVSVKLLLVQIV